MPDEKPQVNLRLPEEIGIPLLRDAKKKKCTIQAVILSVLAGHYGLAIPVPTVGRPKNIEVV